MSTPSWYDLLGVEAGASEDEIRVAWRAAIADLDPTDRRFGSLNRAAEVLLDADRRAAYDAELAAQAPGPEPEPEPEPAPAPAAPTGRRVVPGWLLVGVAVVTLLVAGAAAVVAATVPSDRAVEDASAEARAAAERAIVPILSYDARHLDESRAAAQAHLTGDYREEYDKLFDGVIQQNAPSTGTVVEAELVRSGLVRADDDRAQVFLLVDQTRTNKAEKRPVVYKNWVTVTMEKVDGDWLVAGLDT
ncbi:DnaJ domain-containing protein [Nocardioides sp. YIM 152315]|uniref:J domain-containing protein n=1 Tax=Nocardioides sp. YIM 152315 TaxID=3031760 RepID=UPI0023DB602D|nr:DnaJ domain-containing protein [Nocardioides sp. YIM 152315]MDF1606023.1 DnaJ domain-containing protein [Nocardioides sp. YIM 152315]